jgi:hypothetical protein
MGHGEYWGMLYGAEGYVQQYSAIESTQKCDSKYP